MFGGRSVTQHWPAHCSAGSWTRWPLRTSRQSQSWRWTDVAPAGPEFCTASLLWEPPSPATRSFDGVVIKHTGYRSLPSWANQNFLLWNPAVEENDTGTLPPRGGSQNCSLKRLSPDSNPQLLWLPPDGTGGICCHRVLCNKLMGLTVSSQKSCSSPSPEHHRKSLYSELGLKGGDSVNGPFKWPCSSLSAFL